MHAIQKDLKSKLKWKIFSNGNLASSHSTRKAAQKRLKQLEQDDLDIAAIRALPKLTPEQVEEKEKKWKLDHPPKHGCKTEAEHIEDENFIRDNFGSRSIERLLRSCRCGNQTLPYLPYCGKCAALDAANG